MPVDRSSTAAGQFKLSILIERLAFAALIALFIAFTWPSLNGFYTPDDVLVTYWAWTWDHAEMLKALFIPWIPMFRPLGEAVYLLAYSVFGFNPAGLYVFTWLIFIVNLFAARKFFRQFVSSNLEALICLAVIIVHGALTELYFDAATIFDRLWFTFTAIGVAAYARLRRQGTGIGLLQGSLIWGCCMMAMNSKESGVTLPFLLALYELIFVLPDALKKSTLAQWARSVGPLFAILIVTSLLFVFGRVNRTSVLIEGDYKAIASLGYWLKNVAGYLTMTAYGSVKFGAAPAAILLLIFALLSWLLRSRAMFFGLILFVVTITPVALVRARPGYILYVPGLGLGLYFGVLAATAGRKLASMLRMSAYPLELVALIAMASATGWACAAHWTPKPDERTSLNMQIARQFREEYPDLKPGSRVLFADDYFPPDDSWGLYQTLKLLYRDDKLEVRRLHGSPEQQPEKGLPLTFDYVFSKAPGGRYEELDNKDIERSSRLHILRYASVGSEMSFGSIDHFGYVVSGIIDNNSHDPGRWTEQKAILKFHVWPMDAILSSDMFIPKGVIATPPRNLSVLVNGTQVGVVPLSREGGQQIRFPVRSSLVTKDGFTLVEFAVDRPYREGNQDYGVILVHVGFEPKL